MRGAVLLVSVFLFLPLSDLCAQLRSDPGSPGLGLEISPDSLRITGAEPSGSIAWFGVERIVEPDFSVFRQTRHGVASAGADGTARIPLDPAPSARAFWVVVDLQNGEHAAGAPAGYRLNRLSKEETSCRAETSDGASDDQLLAVGSQVEGLMVRPGVGAWRFSGGDGGPDDEDKTHDGRIRLAQSKFFPVAGAPKAPAKLRADDLWIVIDPVAMSLSVLRGGSAL